VLIETVSVITLEPTLGSIFFKLLISDSVKYFQKTSWLAREENLLRFFCPDEKDKHKAATQKDRQVGDPTILLRFTKELTYRF
jgi:hypothetical protein